MNQPETINQGFGDMLRDARVSAGLSQSDLADRANVGRNTIGRIEAGESCNTEQLTRIAVELGLVLHLAQGD